MILGWGREFESLPFHHVFLSKVSHLAQCWSFLLPDLQPESVSASSSPSGRYPRFSPATQEIADFSDPASSFQTFSRASK